MEKGNVVETGERRVAALSPQFENSDTRQSSIDRVVQVPNSNSCLDENSTEIGLNYKATERRCFKAFEEASCRLLYGSEAFKTCHVYTVIGCC